MRKLNKILFIFFFFLTSCVRVGCYRSHCLDIESTDFECNVCEAISTPSFEEEVCAPWWDIFEDPQLEELISRAVSCHPSVKMAMEKIALSVEESKLLRAKLFPHFNFDLNVSRQKLSDTNEIYKLIPTTLFTEITVNALSMFWNLDIWGKNLSLYLAKKSETQAAIAERALAELVLSLAVAINYFDYQSLLIRINLAKEKLETYESLLNVYQKRVQNAIASRVPLLELEVKMAAVEEYLYTLEGELEISKHALSALVNNACECGGCGLNINASFPCFNHPVPLPRCLPLDLLARRPEILAARWWIESASFNIDSAVANFYPNINLLSYLGLDTTEIGQLFRGKSVIALAEAALSLPLYDAGLRCANLGIAKETLEIAIQEYNQLVLDAVVEVSDWMSLLIEADKKIKVQEFAVAESRDVWKLENERLKNAISSIIPVLESKIIYLDQQDIQIQIQLGKLQSIAGLIKALGGCYG